MEKQGRAEESVWNYPRPPRLESSERRIRIVHRGVPIADTVGAMRILETSHPPVYYLPPADLDLRLLTRARGRGSFCEFKGVAGYWDLDLAPAGSEGRIARAAWSYDSPSEPYAALRGYLAFYPSRLDECTVDGERVQAQPGDFYGGWITHDLRGPFKGAPGTLGW